MARNVIQSEFWTSKMADGSHFVKNFKKNFVLIWNGQKYDRKWFSDIQNGRRPPFFKKHLQKSYASDLNNVQTDCWPTTTWYKFTFGQYIYIHTDSYVGNEGIYIVFAL